MPGGSDLEAGSAQLDSWAVQHAQLQMLAGALQQAFNQGHACAAVVQSCSTHSCECVAAELLLFDH